MTTTTFKFSQSIAEALRVISVLTVAPPLNSNSWESTPAHSNPRARRALRQHFAEAHLKRIEAQPFLDGASPIGGDDGKKRTVTAYLLTADDVLDLGYDAAPEFPVELWLVEARYGEFYVDSLAYYPKPNERVIIAR